MTVGIYEVKTHLAGLLERVEQGEEITITRHGVPIAKIVPIEPKRDKQKIREAIERLNTLSKGIRLDGLSLRELVREGRR